MPFKFPFTNYHELNLDWIIKKIEEITKIFEESSETITVYEERLADAEQDAADALAASASALSTATSAAAAAGNAASAATAAQAAATQAQTRAGQAEAAAGAAQQTATDALTTAQNAESIAQNFVVTPTNYIVEPEIFNVFYDPNNNDVEPDSLTFYTYVYVNGSRDVYTASKISVYAVHQGFIMPASQVDVLNDSSIVFPVPSYLTGGDYIVAKAYKETEPYVYRQIAEFTVPVLSNGVDGDSLSDEMALTLSNYENAYSTKVIDTPIAYNPSAATKCYKKMFPVKAGFTYRVLETFGGTIASSNTRDSVICNAYEIIKQVVSHQTVASSTVTTTFTATLDGFMYWSGDVNALSIKAYGSTGATPIESEITGINIENELNVDMLQSVSITPLNKRIFGGIGNIQVNVSLNQRDVYVYRNYLRTLGHDKTGSTYKGLMLSNNELRVMGNWSSSQGVALVSDDFKQIPATFSNAHLYVRISRFNEFVGTAEQGSRLFFFTYNESGEIYYNSLNFSVTGFGDFVYCLNDAYITNRNIAVGYQSRTPKDTLEAVIDFFITSQNVYDFAQLPSPTRYFNWNIPV